MTVLQDAKEEVVVLSKLNDYIRLATNGAPMYLYNPKPNRSGHIKTCNKVSPKALLTYELVVGKGNINYLIPSY